MCHLVNMSVSDFKELAKINKKKNEKARQTNDKTFEIIELDWIRV
jgi:hypothetical protein